MPLPSKQSQVWGNGRKVFKCVDVHCGGEPARVLLSGCPHVQGRTVEEKRKFFMENLDHVRRVLITEPRGYPCQNLNIIVPPTDPDVAAAGYIIAEQNRIYPLFSGHNTICVVTALLETGMVTMKTPVTNFNLEAPGGLISITAVCSSGRVTEVRMKSMPAFVGKRDVKISVPTIGDVTVDISFGGMWYVVVKADQLGLKISPDQGSKLAKIGEMVKVATKEQCPVSHPTMDYPGPDILVWTEGTGLARKNTVVMSNGVLDWEKPESWSAMLDRSPCGSGTAAVMALLYDRGELKLGEKFTHHSILDTVFSGQLLDTVQVSENVKGVQPEIVGRGWLTSVSDIIVDQDDPLPTGFTVSDIWS